MSVLGGHAPSQTCASPSLPIPTPRLTLSFGAPADSPAFLRDFCVPDLLIFLFAAAAAERSHARFARASFKVE